MGDQKENGMKKSSERAKECWGGERGKDQKENGKKESSEKARECVGGCRGGGSG